jgi:hypothetical protein
MKENILTLTIISTKCAVIWYIGNIMGGRQEEIGRSVQKTKYWKCVLKNNLFKIALTLTPFNK